MNAKKLKQHRNDVKKLLDDSNVLGIKCYKLSAYLEFVEKEIERTYCNHNFKVEPWRTHTSSGKIFTCVK